jgi:DNA-binding GntR family transcriptional regulator
MSDDEPRIKLNGDLPLQDRRLSTDVYAVILRAIHDRQIRPGDRITETEVATQLGISRSPVREAFAQLTNEGLLTHVPRRGSYIATLEEEDISNLRECRQLIEGFAARSLAVRRSPEVIQTLESLIEQMIVSANERNWVQTVYINSQFHETVVKASGNSILHRMWATVDPLAWLVAATKQPGQDHDPDDLNRRHRLLIDALMSGDPNEAERAFRQHVAESLVPVELTD